MFHFLFYSFTALDDRLEFTTFRYEKGSADIEILGMNKEFTNAVLRDHSNRWRSDVHLGLLSAIYLNVLNYGLKLKGTRITFGWKNAFLVRRSTCKYRGPVYDVRTRVSTMNIIRAKLRCRSENLWAKTQLETKDCLIFSPSSVIEGYIIFKSTPSKPIPVSKHRKGKCCTKYLQIRILYFFQSVCPW